MLVTLTVAAALLVPVTETKQPPQAPPTSVVIVACRVDDWTGKRPLPPNIFPARDWKDLELHVENGELQCKREVLNLEDATLYSPKALMDMLPLHPDFSEWTQCARVGVVQAAEYNKTHPGWGVVGVGCPVPIMDDNGTPEDFLDDRIIGFKLPECPSHLPGHDDAPMKCRFDASII